MKCDTLEEQELYRITEGGVTLLRVESSEGTPEYLDNPLISRTYAFSNVLFLFRFQTR